MAFGEASSCASVPFSLHAMSLAYFRPFAALKGECSQALTASWLGEE